MKKGIVIFVVVVVLMIAGYFVYDKLKKKEDDETTDDETLKEKLSSTTIKNTLLGESKKAANQQKEAPENLDTKLSEVAKPPTTKTADETPAKPIPLLLGSPTVQAAILDTAKKVFYNEDEYKHKVLEAGAIGAKLVPMDKGWYVDDFLNAKYGIVSYLDIKVKPKLLFETQLANLKKIADGMSHQTPEKSVPNLVKVQIYDIVEVDLLHGKKGDAWLNKKSDKRIDFVKEWCNIYLKESDRASDALKAYALEKLIASGWNIQTGG